MKIGEAARRVGLPIKTVRYYAEIGLVTPAEVRKSGFREYGEPELRRLRMVARARQNGFSIEECRLLMRFIDDPIAASDATILMAMTKRAALDQQLAELLSLRSTLDQLITAWEKDRRAPKSSDPPRQRDLFKPTSPDDG